MDDSVTDNDFPEEPIMGQMNFTALDIVLLGKIILRFLNTYIGEKNLLFHQSQSRLLLKNWLNKLLCAFVL